MNKKKSSSRLKSAFLMLIGSMACGPSNSEAPGVRASNLVDGARVTFESTPVGPYARAQAERDFAPGRVDYMTGNLSVASDCATGGRCTRVRYDRRQAGPRHGAQFPVDFASVASEAYLEYDVYFEPGFEWDGEAQSGGKLPGLCGGNCPSGGPSNYPGTNQARNGEGFSARFMWRDGGQLTVYLYYRDMPGDYGQDLYMDDGYVLPVGRTLRIKQYVRVNTGSNANGVLRVWVDGDLKLDRNDLRFLTTNHGVNRFFFSTFYGGGSPDWGPSQDTFAQFDNIRVSTDDPGRDGLRGGCFEPSGFSVATAREWWQEFRGDPSHRSVEVEFRNGGGDVGRHSFQTAWGKWVTPGGVHTPNGTEARLFVTQANGDQGRTDWFPFEASARIVAAGCP